MTKREIDKLGERIGASQEVADEDLEQLQAYRQTFQKPLARVFEFVLASARKLDRQCIVTYRIKRIDTIIGKLRRFKDNDNGQMHLSRMWDIACCRCILNTPDNEKLYQLKDIILKEYGVDCKMNDYVATPRASGYRSIHIYVKDKETQTPIEIQIRNNAQHNWATLVEIVTFSTFKDAEKAYYEKYLANSDSNIVLTHIMNADFDQISMAYSNYVLAMHAFFDDYRALLADRIIESLKGEHYRHFFRYFRVYNSDVRGHIGNMSMEMKSISACYNDSSLSRSQINNWVKEIQNRSFRWQREVNDFLKRLSYVSHGDRFKRWVINNRVKGLKRAVSEGLRFS